MRLVVGFIIHVQISSTMRPKTDVLVVDELRGNRSGVLGGQQHGVTRVIQSCDADDPGCSFRISPISYAAGHWRSSEPMKNPALTLQVRQDMKKPSSFEDDIGIQSTVHVDLVDGTETQ